MLRPAGGKRGNKGGEREGREGGREGKRGEGGKRGGRREGKGELVLWAEGFFCLSDCDASLFILFSCLYIFFNGSCYFLFYLSAIDFLKKNSCFFLFFSCIYFFYLYYNFVDL